MKIKIPYDKKTVDVEMPEHRVKAVIVPSHDKKIETSEPGIVKKALESPINSERLSVLAEGKNNVLIITSDHTRPLPSKITLPVLLEETRVNNPGVNIKILIATGFHRETTREEILDKFGPRVTENEEIIVHDAFNKDNMLLIGILPSGGELWINNLIEWADLIVAEGFIEPHMFAGFSGGRKSILPGICSKETIMYNHNAEFIGHRCSRTGILEGNPLHEDMVFAAKIAGLDFILNVALDQDKKIISAFSGNPEDAHVEGCSFVRERAVVSAVKSDIVVTSNGGYPLDQNVYQSVKGMTAAEACVNPGGIIIILAGCRNGHGGESFFKWFKESESPAAVLEKIDGISREDTIADQWEAQIMARIQVKCSMVILVSDLMDPEMIKDMHLVHANNFKEALDIAEERLGKEKDIVFIPDGVGVIVEDNNQ